MRNVTGTGFDIRVQEWLYLDGLHVRETVGFMVVERGHHLLPDGNVLQAGAFDFKAEWTTNQKVTFAQPFPTKPVVVTSIATFAGGDTVLGRVHSVTGQSFSYRFQEEEARPQQHVRERVNYIAWQFSSGMLPGNPVSSSSPMSGHSRRLVYRYQVGISPSVDHNPTHISLSSFGEGPVFLADMQTAIGGDTAGLRWRDKDAEGVEVWVSEERSRDHEIGHVDEQVGFIAVGLISSDGACSSSDCPGGGPIGTCDAEGDSCVCRCPAPYLGDGKTCGLADACSSTPVAALTGLELPSGGTLAPAFEPSITSYTVKLPSATSTIRFKPLTPCGWSVKLKPNYSLALNWGSPHFHVAPGNNDFEIVVSGAGKASQVYHLNVVRPMPAESKRSVPLLVLLMDFADTTMPTSASVNEPAEVSWARLMFGMSQGQGNHYWNEVSRKLFEMAPAKETAGVANNGVVHVRLPQKAPTSGRHVVQDQSWVPDALDLASAHVAFDSYDTNNDGVLQNTELSVLVVVNLNYVRIDGAGAQANIALNHVVDGVKLEKFARTLGDYTSIGVNLHELGHHIFGLKHLMAPKGGYSLMDMGSYNEDPVITTFSSSAWRWGTRPSHLTAFSKVKAGFVTPDVLQGTTYGVRLKKSTSSQYNVVSLPTLGGYTLYLEYRQPEGYESSMAFCQGKGGVFAQEVGVTESALRIPFEAEDYEMCDFQSFWGHNDDFRIGNYRLRNFLSTGDVMTFDAIYDPITPEVDHYYYRYWVPDPNRTDYRIWVHKMTEPGVTTSIDYQEMLNPRLMFDAKYNTGEVRDMATAEWSTASKYLKVQTYPGNLDENHVPHYQVVGFSVDPSQP
ncbi:MAG: cadherin-like beta sandwich domain-containing protein, partial [Deltaproteobacteria bacterium]|nr:cadherin-like beta sandwich domain-containing protein [Deltaproteobacteria bacterium]